MGNPGGRGIPGSGGGGGTPRGIPGKGGGGGIPAPGNGGGRGIPAPGIPIMTNYILPEACGGTEELNTGCLYTYADVCSPLFSIKREWKLERLSTNHAGKTAREM